VVEIDEEGVAAASKVALRLMGVPKGLFFEAEVGVEVAVGLEVVATGELVACIADTFK
jgi:hypothetical protein